MELPRWRRGAFEAGPIDRAGTCSRFTSISPGTIFCHLKLRIEKLRYHVLQQSVYPGCPSSLRDSLPDHELVTDWLQPCDDDDDVVFRPPSPSPPSPVSPSPSSSPRPPLVASRPRPSRKSGRDFEAAASAALEATTTTTERKGGSLSLSLWQRWRRRRRGRPQPLCSSCRRLV